MGVGGAGGMLSVAAKNLVCCTKASLFCLQMDLYAPAIYTRVQKDLSKLISMSGRLPRSRSPAPRRLAKVFVHEYNMLAHKHYEASEIEQVLQAHENSTMPPEFHKYRAKESSLREWRAEFSKKLNQMAFLLRK
jgi:hypothetical protein